MAEHPVKVFSVSEITTSIKRLLASSFGTVCVEGEIVGIKNHNGHLYFSLKDETAQLNAVIFSRVRMTLPPSLELKDGAKIRAYGELSVFESRGQYQLVVRKAESAGAGDLMRRFEELKQKLEAEGLFAAERKRKLPFMPHRIGVVTSPSGAVIHDIMDVLWRRFPNVQLRLAPVRVQGDGAARQIAYAVEKFNEWYGPNSGTDWPMDLMIVGRGGGSLEDLWCFNEEMVARAVAASAIPVISAVGHETDFTLCDFAADVRAPTPSAAAELAVPVKADLEKQLRRFSELSRSLLTRRLETLKARLNAVKSAPMFRRPLSMAEERIQLVDTLQQRLVSAAKLRESDFTRRLSNAEHALAVCRERVIARGNSRIEAAAASLDNAAARWCEKMRLRIDGLSGQLRLLNPLAVLDRGYSVTHTEDGKLVKTVGSAPAGTVLVTRLPDGQVRSVVS